MRDTLKRQKQNTRDEFDERVRETVTQFAERVGLVLHVNMSAPWTDDFNVFFFLIVFTGFEFCSFLGKS